MHKLKMRSELAKYFGIVEIVDELFYQFHRIPTAALNKLDNWSEYKTIKTHSTLGYTMLAAYVTNAAAFVASGGTEKLYSPENIMTMLSVPIVCSIHSWFFYKNTKEARIAEARERVLENLNLEEAFAHEEDLQRYKGIRNAPWYLFSLFMWYGFMKMYSYLGSVDMSDPAVRGMIISGTIATLCAHAPRYILSTKYGLSSLKDALNGGSKNEKKN